MFKRVLGFLAGVVIGSIVFIPPYDEAMKERHGDEARKYDGRVIPVFRAISNTFWHGVKRILGY